MTAVLSAEAQSVLFPDSEMEGDAVFRPRKRALRYPLSDEQLRFYRDNGYLILRGVFSAEEIETIRAAGDALATRTDLLSPDNLRYEYDPKTGVVWKVDPFCDISEACANLVRDRRICDPLASIYDGHEPRLFKDKYILKPPHTHGNGLHQDRNWWQGFPDSLLSVAIAIDPADESNGCTMLYPGRWDRLLSEAGSLKHDIGAHVDASTAVPFITQPGDMVIFGCFTPHSAGPNDSDRTRRQIFLSYNDSRDGEWYWAHREHFWWYRTVRLEDAARRRAYFR